MIRLIFYGLMGKSNELSGAFTDFAHQILYFQQMKPKEVFRDQSVWSLFIINVAIIVYYLYYNTGFKTLVWIYWTQSVIIGVFTFLELATIKNMVPGSLTMGNKPAGDEK